MRLIDAEKFEVFDATCQITKGIRSGKTAAYFYGEGCRKVLEAIDAAPTIAPESLRPTAHWIAEFVSEVYGPEAAYGGRGDYICGFYCSNCHNEAILNEAGEDFTPKFCPECGARMVNAGD